MDIEIRRGLAEARMLASEHWRPLLAYMLLGVVLPFLLFASEPVLSMDAILALAIAPEDFRLTGSIVGPLYLLGICATLLCAAMLALWSATLADIREGYIAEIMYGMVAGTAWLIAGLLFYYLIGFLLALPFRLTVGMEVARAEGTPIAIARQILLTLIGAWLNARLCLTGPIMAAGGRLEPVTALAESWRRTERPQWRLFALCLAFNIVVAAAVALLFLLHGYLILGGEEMRPAAMAMSAGWLLFWGLCFAAVTLVPAGLYRASQPGGSAEAFA
ncbi:MAG: glycerophosphoryl diester phosphodiesterase membrane domain-containing protein [Sphingopyxis sp.]|nr:glycerophosphoryl diester phosphodiesterase membrane domain-containing protein [Sphingopyxis sp.]